MTRRDESKSLLNKDRKKVMIYVGEGIQKEIFLDNLVSNKIVSKWQKIAVIIFLFALLCLFIIGILLI